MPVLFVKTQGAVLQKDGLQVKVVLKEGNARSFPLRTLSRVALFGHVSITTRAMAALLGSGVETVLLTREGRYLGRLQPPESGNVFLRRAQFRRCDDAAFSLEVARTLVSAKLNNSRTLLRRHHENHPDPFLHDAIDRLEAAAQRAWDAGSPQELLGIEGDATRCYFSALGRAVRSEFAFTGRSRRPPRDPVNALLSFGYALLTSELEGACAAQGLDPQAGFLHSLHYNRPSLALDLLEEFRQPVSDRLALNLVNRRELRIRHFQITSSGTRLSDEGLEIYFRGYHALMESPAELFRDDGGSAAAPVTWRDLLVRQAERMREAILGEGAYRPFRWPLRPQTGGAGSGPQGGARSQRTSSSSESGPQKEIRPGAGESSPGGGGCCT